MHVAFNQDQYGDMMCSSVAYVTNLNYKNKKKYGDMIILNDSDEVYRYKFVQIVIIV